MAKLSDTTVQFLRDREPLLAIKSHRDEHTLSLRIAQAEVMAHPEYATGRDAPAPADVAPTHPPWISIRERMPTQADADRRGYVFWWVPKAGKVERGAWGWHIDATADPATHWMPTHWLPNTD